MKAGFTAFSGCPEPKLQAGFNTSTATVAVLPEAEDIDLKIDPKDLKIEVPLEPQDRGGRKC